MQKSFTTKNSKETQKLGEMLAEEVLAEPRFDLEGDKSASEVEPQGAFIICLSGDLGAGKTTFTQGFLKGLGAEGPYTSPTFLVIKKYSLKANGQRLRTAYHIDAYRVESADVLDLGWEEITSDNSNVIIVEWAERIKDIIPSGALWIDFKWKGEEEREVTFKNSPNS